MRSRWSQGGGEGQHPPVEMRFVDMFMTALGSLIFIAMLLVFLLPKAAQPSTDPAMDPRALQAKLDDTLRTLGKEIQIRKDLQQLLQNVSQVDKDVVKRWLAVTLLTKGCPAYEPRLYVRWEGPVVDPMTGKSVVDPVTGKTKDTLDAFDASAPRMHRLVGNGMLFSGPTVGPSALTEWFNKWLGAAPSPLLDRTGVAVTSFFAVSRGPGDRSIYIGLSDPRSLKGGECSVQPIIHGSSGRAVDDVLKLSLAQPFAWIRRVRLENDGEFKSPTPRFDIAFQRELEAFSAEQSQKLCEKKLICGTMDAHWAKYAKPASPREALNWKLGYRFTRLAIPFATKFLTTFSECERACLDEPFCAAAEYASDRNACELHDTLPAEKSAPGSRSSVGIRTPSPLHWLVDRAVSADDKVFRTLAWVSREDCATACLGDARCQAVEYYKPTNACHIFASRPKVVPSPIGPYGPTDVGIRTRR